MHCRGLKSAGVTQNTSVNERATGGKMTVVESENTVQKRGEEQSAGRVEVKCHQG